MFILFIYFIVQACSEAVNILYSPNQGYFVFTANSVNLICTVLNVWQHPPKHRQEPPHRYKQETDTLWHIDGFAHAGSYFITWSKDDAKGLEHL